jgi:hypothetical protein
MSFFVMKRDGRRESVHFDKITSRVNKLCYGLDQKVRSRKKDGMMCLLFIVLDQQQPMIYFTSSAHTSPLLVLVS